MPPQCRMRQPHPALRPAAGGGAERLRGCPRQDQPGRGAGGSSPSATTDAPSRSLSYAPDARPWRTEMTLTLSRPWTQAATLLALALSLVTLASCGYNTIPTLEEAAKAKWADVQNNYQRRADLIPNLVATVEGYAKQEKDVLTSVVEARAKVTQVRVDASQLTDPEKMKQFQDAQNQLSGALGRLIAISEAYPDLKSNQNFLALQSQLEGTENRITVARKDYIEAVRVYNTDLRTFPGIIWASTLYKNNKPMETFTVAEDVKTPPQVKF